MWCQIRVTPPTLKQVEAFSRAVHVPVGYLFLAQPPEESVPVPDFRTFAGEPATRPTPNILNTVYICQEPQSCYREFARITQQTEANFVSSVTVALPSQTVAARMRETLGFDLAARRLQCATPIGIAAS